MNTKHLGVLGLLLAMIFGARGASRPAEPHPSSTQSFKAGSKDPNKDKKAPAKAKGASAAEAGDCAAIASARKTQWWLTSPNPKGCAVALSPVWKQICKINPNHKDDAFLLSPTLTEKDFVAGCVGDPSSTRSMMAAVPNPQRTHLGLMTDRAIEAIQVAAAEAHFLPLAHYLPWPAPGAEVADSGAEGALNPSEPGVLVFRDVDDPQAAGSKRPKNLLVFLIPEVPTEGLDRQAFANAEGMIEKASPGMDRIPLAGPNFSGSVGSLIDLSRKDFNSAAGLPKCIQALSGSVTNAEAYSKGCSSFEVMETRDSEAICRFVVGAKAFGYGGNQIAILSEEGTVYGRQENEKDKEQTTNNTAPAGNAVKSDGPRTVDCSRAGQDGATAQLWFLHFPREISKLRNAYGAEAGKTSTSDNTTQTGLGLQWEDAGAAQHDDLQTYGQRQTPLSQETVLSTLSVTLKAQGIKALGVLATDPMDELFLIHSIRESSPDVRLFLRDPDLLFLRTPDVGSLNGTLLVSNYPLIPQNQFWSSRQEPANDKLIEQKNEPEAENQPLHRLMTFPSSFQEGEYNAFVQLIQDQHWGTGHAMKRLEWEWPAGDHAENFPDPQCAFDCEKYRPNDPACANSEFVGKEYSRFGCRPLWLATIGTAGHYPITILNYDQVQKAKLSLHSLNLGPPQFAPIAVWALIAMLGILHFLALRFPRAVPSYFRHDFDLEDKSSIVTLVKLFCHTMAVLTITIAQFILGSSYLFFFLSDSKYPFDHKSPFKLDPFRLWIANLKYLPLACAVLAVTFFLLWVVGRQFHCSYVLYQRQRHLPVTEEGRGIVSPKRIFVGCIVAITIFVAAGLFWAGIVFWGRFDNAFLHFRNLNLTSGVTPNIPLVSVLLVLYFGVWTYLRRLSYWQHRYVAMFSLKLDQVIHRDMGPHVRAIDSCLLGPLENRNWMIAFLATLAGCILAFRPWVTLDMIEPNRVGRFILFFFILTLLTMWLNWFRFINIWIHLRAILDYLENLPVRAAFRRLPQEKSMPILQWSSSPGTFLLRQVLDRVRALACVDPSGQNIALRNQFEQRINALSTGVGAAQVVGYEKVAGGPDIAVLGASSRDPKELLRDARREMQTLTETLSGQLLQDYWMRGSSGTGQEDKPQPGDHKFILAEDIVALPFYAYVRKVIGELRNILFFLGLAISLLFMALHTYAFRADQAIDWWFFGLFAAMGTGAVVVVAQMERNALLSRLSNRTAGELGTNFYLQILKYGTVPFLTIFGSQVPWISNVVLKWVQPAVEALH